MKNMVQNIIAPLLLSSFIMPGLMISSISIAKTNDPDINILDHRVDNLAYGNALYEYFLDRPVRALTFLEVAKKRNEISPDDPYPSLFNANLSLSYGLNRRAKHQLEKLNHLSLSDEINHQIYFYLGKHAYYQGLDKQSLSELGKINDTYIEKFNYESLYYQAQIHFNQDNMELTKQLQQQIPDNIIWRPYLDYNLGLKYAKDKNFQQAHIEWNNVRKQAKKILSQKDSDGYFFELTALQERASISESIFLSLEEDWKGALKALKNVRTNSPWINPALLSFGINAIQGGELGLAWSALLQLKEQPWDSNEKQAAMITLAQISEQQAASTQAELEQLKNSQKTRLEEQLLNQLKAARLSYEEANQYLESRLSHNLSLLQTQEFDTWYVEWQQKIIQNRQSNNNHSDSLTGQLLQALPTEHLRWSTWLAKKENTASLTQLENIQALETELEHWTDALPHLATILQTRQEAFQQRLASISDDTWQNHYSTLKRNAESFKPAIEELNQPNNHWTLAHEKTIQLQQRVATNQARFYRLNQAGILDKIESKRVDETLRRSQGVLIWDLAMIKPIRQWQAKKALIQTQAALNQTEHHLNNLRQLRRGWNKILTQGKEIQDFSQHILTVQQKIDHMKNTLHQKIRSSLREEIKEQISVQKQYLALAKFQRARLADQLWELNNPMPEDQASEDEASEERSQ